MVRLTGYDLEQKKSTLGEAFGPLVSAQADSGVLGRCEERWAADSHLQEDTEAFEDVD